MKFKEYNQNQGIFKVIIPNELLDKDDPARLIDKVIERLDLSGIESYYQEVGNTAYHPKMQLKVLFYSYYKGIHSCRNMWSALKRHADFIFLSGDQLPDFRTINDFRKLHIEKMPDLFTQIVMMCESLGMIGFEHMAIDGQKIHANANYRKSFNRERLDERFKKVKEGITKLLSTEVDTTEKKENTQRRVKRLQAQEKRLEILSVRLKEMEEENLKKENPKKEVVINMTDADASMMRHKDGTSKPSYNHQSAVDDKYGVTTAVETLDVSDKGEQLLPLVDEASQNTDGTFSNITADAGFGTYQVLTDVATKRTENFYIPDSQINHQEILKGKFGSKSFPITDGTMKCPAGLEMHLHSKTEEANGDKLVFIGVGCADCPLKMKCTDGKNRTVTIVPEMKYRDIMREKLNTDLGRETYSKRQGTVESTHGDDQKNKKWKQHHLRGKAKAGLEFLLIRIGANLGKMVRFRAPEILAWA